MKTEQKNQTQVLKQVLIERLQEKNNELKQVLKDLLLLKIIELNKQRNNWINQRKN